MVFFHNINPVIVQLGPVEIRWYGLMYVFAFLFALWYVKKASKEGKIKLDDEQIDNFFVWLTVALIVGARLFAVVFWDFSYYAQHPLEIFAFWKGGLSFHGGLVGVIVAAFLLCRKHNISFLHLADIFIVPLALGQAFGRIGNFINGELYGIPTLLPWGVNFFNEVDAVGNFVFRHPSQLYEVLYDVAIFIFLWLLKDKKLKNGFLFATFLLLYAVFRTLTEFIRVPEGMIGPLTISQAFNIPMFVAGLWLLLRRK
ncbi:prolipoprotein diacylglyceryl transferase [Candidatus Woesearchaeota archaeon]|nr:prolipoprotein diacylglyceryl transferase [Candidatus Woesearchaeota archaeon]